MMLTIGALLLACVSILAAAYTYLCTQGLTRDMRLELDLSLDPLWWVPAALLTISAATAALALWRMASWASGAFVLFSASLVAVLFVGTPWQDLSVGGTVAVLSVLAAIVVGLAVSFRIIRLY